MAAHTASQHLSCSADLIAAKKQSCDWRGTTLRAITQESRTRRCWLLIGQQTMAEYWQDNCYSVSHFTLQYDVHVAASADGITTYSLCQVLAHQY